MKTFVSQLCFGLSVLVLAGCGGDDDSGSSPTTSTGGAGGTGGTGGAGGGSTSGGGEAGSGGAPDSDCESPPRENELVIAGAYGDGYASHRIDDEVWVLGSSLFELLDFSNEEHWAIAHNDPENEYSPGAFSRFDWTIEDGQLYYCQTEFEAASEEEAREAEPSDADDLVTGCAGVFPWSLLTPISVVGSYTDDFHGTHTITPSAWLMGDSVFHLLEFSNDETWAVAQNDCANPYSPGLYSRFDWVGGAAGSGAGGGAGAGGADAGGSAIYFCQTGYNLESAAAASALPPADGSDLAQGCSGYSWSKLTAD